VATMTRLPLVDRYGRVATDLRVSLTDRCNLRCTYCMPAEGLAWLPSPRLLSDAEVVRLVRLAVLRLGVTEVRFTGGEPLLRPGLVGIVAACADLGVPLSLTTNGIGLARLAPSLREAGLTRVNVSLDTLDPDRFQELTRRRRLDDVLAGLSLARSVGFDPIKINTVLLRGVNEDEAAALLDFALAGGYELRFIEQMPLDAGHTWRRENMVPAAEILAALRSAHRLDPDPRVRGASPAQTWLVDGGPARVGVIASVTGPFCGACDRTRLTADGAVRSCLFSQTETDLRTLLRSGGSDQSIAEAWAAAMFGKPAAHGIDQPGFRQPERPMSAIGG
jgi:cyclic pyranopterin phosphate synthase